MNPTPIAENLRIQRGIPQVRMPDLAVAAGILKDPQAHIDALVEAGVLLKRGHVHGAQAGGVRYDYAVAQPHKHDWRVDRLARSLPGGPFDYLVFECRCGGDLSLPIEVPA